MFADVVKVILNSYYIWILYKALVAGKVSIVNCQFAKLVNCQMLFLHDPINSALLGMYAQSTFQLVVNEINVRKMEKWLTDGMFAWTTDLSILLVLVSACMPRDWEATFLKVCLSLLRP